MKTPIEKVKEHQERVNKNEQKLCERVYKKVLKNLPKKDYIRIGKEELSFEVQIKIKNYLNEKIPELEFKMRSLYDGEFVYWEIKKEIEVKPND